MIKTDFINNIFCCPSCFGILKNNGSSGVICHFCSREIKIKENIPVFTQNEAYWCNFPKEMMSRLNKEAEEKGFSPALESIIKDKEIRDYIVEEGRVDPLFFMPVNSQSVVLDVGCKWGGLTIPFSGYCKTVVGVDTTFETLKFLEIRARQLNKKNIHLAVASALELPFKENSFDAVILNGVLEWLGHNDEFDASRDYGKPKERFRARNVYNEHPDKMQKKGLENIFRVLKPGGVLFIGIENRFALSYFMGAPEDHANLKYVGILPRSAANWYMKKKLNREFRTYTYSMPALRGILKNIGFGEISFFAAYPSYREPDYVFSLDAPHLLRYFMENCQGYESKNMLKRTIRNFLAKTGIYKYLVPSFLVLAKKG